TYNLWDDPACPACSREGSPGSRSSAVPSHPTFGLLPRGVRGLSAGSSEGRPMPNSFDARSTFLVDGQTFHYYRLDALGRSGLDVARLRFSLNILRENLRRHEDGVTGTASDIKALAAWDPKAEPDREIAFRPARVLLQDFTGVPAIVDLAAMRDAMKRLGGDPRKINPLQPVELVIDHSVQVDEAGTPHGLPGNVQRGLQGNHA